jgi:hypothetical protein
MAACRIHGQAGAQKECVPEVERLKMDFIGPKRWLVWSPVFFGTSFASTILMNSGARVISDGVPTDANL